MSHIVNGLRGKIVNVLNLLGANLNIWRSSGCILYNQKQFGSHFNNMCCLKNKVTLLAAHFGCFHVEHGNIVWMWTQ